ncbi:MAG: hypothetical protein A3I61_12960 [Acidobacteria bacterium RIFCSPLOWO2_02_FULL_68_18]|nr:MAG: hypothetical protein A3I61_12960 [Acidobacteria bacterium RIFCSPLOWO2_02_FULL_68_18]OFW51862.1 MAG: hypothetical protein A3G77_00605 [Acidobacteria bacterium RIFCSPLOWO2_12_FULL_68_19]
MRRHLLSVASVACLAAPLPVAAQEARPSVLAIDTAAAIEQIADFDGNVATGLSMDALVSIGRPGLEAIVWPVAQRFNSGQWVRDVWIATLRYERPGPVGVRLDGGLIPSPVGLANLTVRRPHLNPTISQPSSLFAALPPLELRAPRPTLLGAVYPLGTQITVSGSRWDARAALMDTSPLRRRRILSRTNPPRFATVLVGGGVTPVVGLRLGASVTRGGWLREGEGPAVTATQYATIVTIESEFAFRYTRVAGEWVRDRIETTLGRRVASGWFVHGQQTLAPRWFAAGRIERIDSPLVLQTDAVEQQLTGVEAVLGFRVTPDLTVRIGHRARRTFGRPAYDHQAAVSLVWWRRWM